MSVKKRAENAAAANARKKKGETNTTTYLRFLVRKS
jgi:hypothetical protein